VKKFMLSVLTLAAAGLICQAALPPDELVKKITAAIHEHCPDAATQLTNGLYVAKNGTILFTLHRHQMTGEILAEKYQQEGPNFKGFVLTIGIEPGRYSGQAAVPQELHGPYFPTFITAPPAEDGTNHYWITFSYGSGLDPELKKAIFGALPKANLGGTNHWQY
jgi:hypothetical protein